MEQKKVFEEDGKYDDSDDIDDLTHFAECTPFVKAIAEVSGLTDDALKSQIKDSWRILTNLDESWRILMNLDESWWILTNIDDSWLSLINLE